MAAEGKETGLVETIFEKFPLLETILVACIILAATWAVEHVTFKIIKHIGRSSNNPLPASSIFANIARVCIWLLGAALLCKVCFNYDITAFIAALGVGGIAISLGFQDTLLNLIGGLQVSIGKLVEPGEYIEVLGQRGQVVDVSWRHTTIRDFDGMTHLVPNSLMNKNSLIDLGECELVRVPFLIPVDTDIDGFTERVTADIKKGLGESLGERGITVRFAGEEYGGLAGKVTVDVARRDYTPEMAANAVSRAIDPALKAAGMTI